MMPTKKTRVLEILAVILGAGLVIFGAQQAWRVSSDPANGSGDRVVPGPAGTTDPGGDQAAAPIQFRKNPKPVPEFTVHDLDGRAISPADWRGKVTIVNFWATWCGPCLQEIPDFIALQEKYRDQLQIIGLSMDEGPADQVRRFVEEHGITYPVAIAGSDLAATFAVLGLPTTLVLDPQGRVVQEHVGLTSPAIYEQEVRALAGVPVAAAVGRGRGTGD